MNIFIIPSWYPNEQNPVDGIFVKEQAEALADLYPEHNFIISHCENFYLSVSQPGHFFKTLKRYSGKKHNIKTIKNNLIEYYRPALSWTEKFGGEVKNIIKAHVQNFQEAKKNLGQIDIMHAHVSYPGGFSAMKIKGQFNVPFVITEHMAPFPFEKFIDDGKISEKISEPLNKADEVITVSNYTADVIKSFGFERPVVIPNMVNENLFYPPDNSFRNKRIKFLTATTFTERKGIEELMNGILKSVKMSSDIEFTISGTGEMEKHIEQFIGQNSLSEKVKLIKNPSREELIQLFRECDVFILPSRLESFGIVYVEAMACGKPVIATDCGGPADFMKDFTGKLIPVKDVSAISEAIKFMAENISGYSSKRIRQYYLLNYSQQAVCPEIIDLYKTVLKN